MTPAAPSGFWEVIAHVGQIAPILEALAVLATAILAYKTINAWRPENVGKRKFEIAEKSLLAFYDLKESLVALRLPLESSPSLTAIEAFETHRSQYYNRFAYFSGVMGQENSLPGMRPLFRVYFGFDAGKPFDRLLAAAQELHGALNEVFTTVPKSGTDLSPLPELLDILGWSGAERPDAIDHEINGAVREMERLCKPFLEGRK